MSRTLLAIAVGCTAVQILSAAVIVKDFRTPNVSVEIAQRLIATGEFRVDAPLVLEPAYAYQLPGEPLLLSLGLRLPQPLRRYVHVPVVVLFIVSIAAVGLAIGGPRLAAAAAAIASLDPFVVVHGPVWDDTTLSAALEWAALAALTGALATGSQRPARRLTAALTGAAAALTRTHSQVFLLMLAVIAAAGRRFRPARAAAVAMALGVLIAAGAWGWRNQATVGTFIIGSTHDGKTLFESTYATARGAILANGVAMRFEEGRVPPQFLVPQTNEVAANAYFTAEAWRYLREHPADVAVTGLLKIGVSVTGVDFGQSLLSSRNLITVAFNVVLWLVAIRGIVTWMRDPIAATPAGRFVGAAAATMALTTMALLALGPVGLRYRIQLAGFVYLAAAFALHARSRAHSAAISARM